MEEALQHETTTQRIGLSPTGPGSHRPDGPKADDALAFKMGHSSGADQGEAPVKRESGQTLSNPELPPQLCAASLSDMPLAQITRREGRTT